MNGAAIQNIFAKNMYIHVLMVISMLKLGECHNNLYGTAELRSTLPRRSRLLTDFISNIPDDNSRSAFIPAAIPLSSSSYSRSLTPTDTSATESSVSSSIVLTSPAPNDNEPTPTADTMRKYARILKIDTENMNEEQRELLLRIVQRIARLNGARPDEESIDLNVNEGRARRKHRDDRKKKKTSSNAASDVLKSSTSKTTNAATSPTSSTSSSSSSKHRTTPPTQSGNGDRSSSSTTTSTTIASKKKVAPSNYIAISTVTASATTPTIAATKVGKSKVTPSTDLTMSNATSMDLGNISTTSIVDVLSTDNARENFYIRRPSPSTITALHNKIQPQKVSV